jgi:XTP/dITP diphosphohydrolase
MIDVFRAASKKLVHRHPHVFGSTEVTGTEQVLQNWESQKMKEGQRSILEGVPASMPALLRAQRIQHKVSNVGFDWDDREDVWAKIEEELGELKHELLAHDKQKAKEELGDFIFAVVNAARFEDIMAEEALQWTNDKFTRRFKFIEARAKELGKNMKDMTLGEMDEIWNEAKSKE